MKNNTDYLIKKLRKFNLPLPRKKMNLKQKQEIEEQIKEIEDSIVIFKKHMNRF
ncbi:hypothetical protein [uncultured Psychroserpens sp.]|uniref:hypothetical protein n=1 Tax=uncultured Psychroserpens sp. TaxID=255436 RepID=UPI00262F9068|nr:hypothetical protein [uncultured Psychroserpens sp.]